MSLRRRRFLRLAAGAVALPAVSRGALAQSYPTKPVRIIVGFAAGGATDVYARLLVRWLSERLGQSFVVENRSGAGSNIATQAVVTAAPDGYTFLMATSSNAVNASLYEKLSYDFIRDVAPIALVAYTPLVVVVHPSVPVKTIPELISYAKANPGKLNMGSGGIGSPPHVAGELFKMMTGVDMLLVNYRGGAPAVADLLGGQVLVMFNVMPESLEYIRTEKLRALAVTAATRSEALPDIPTVAEFVPGFEGSFWAGVGAPKNTSVEIIGRLNKEINAALADPVLKARFAELGSKVLPNSPVEFGNFVADETAKWAKVIKFAGIKAD
jgi:tripartite-type tricarboxylate transporter receptor subunit TctC